VGGSAGGESPASTAPMKGPHGHPGQRAILEGHVKEVAATIKAAKAARAGGGDGASGPPGKYRPEYKLGGKDLSDAVVNTIAGEARPNQTSTDAVINNMLNRVGSKGWGPSGNLEEVARAPSQYEGYQRASAQRAEFIRSRIKAIASGSEPDITAGSNAFRASSYHGRWAQKHADSPIIGGNRFAYDPSVVNGPYAPYANPKEVASGDGYSAPGAGVKKNGYTDYFPDKGYGPGGDSAKSRDIPVLKDNMTTSEINAWNDAHKELKEHGATLRDRLSGAKKAAEAGFHDIKGKVKDFRDPELDKFIKGSQDHDAAVHAKEIAGARMGLLTGHHIYHDQNTIFRHAFRVYESSKAAHAQLLKQKHDAELIKRQGEANTGGTGGYGFKPWEGQNIPDKGITPGHDIGKHSRGEQDPAWRPRGYGPDYGPGGRNNLDLNGHHRRMERADLLGNARKAGMMGNQSQKVTGEASMRIDLRGFPKGTKTKTEMSGMFSQIRVARGRAMPLANQDS
jgi:hypothetical protein